MLSQIINMVTLQQQVDTIMSGNPDIPKILVAPHRAAGVEGIELIEHLGYKWWKKSELDNFLLPTTKFSKENIRQLSQARMEIVDIYHFTISHMLMYTSVKSGYRKYHTTQEVDVVSITLYDFLLNSIAKISLSETDDNILNRLNSHSEYSEVLNSVDILTGKILLKEVDETYFEHLYRVGLYLGMDFDVLYKHYIGKNALNRFRQNIGKESYQSSYKRVWNDGLEDNEHLSIIIDEFDEHFHSYTLVDIMENIIKQLSNRYNHINKV